MDAEQRKVVVLVALFNILMALMGLGGVLFANADAGMIAIVVAVASTVMLVIGWLRMP